jgi:hypothetical protein
MEAIMSLPAPRSTRLYTLRRPAPRVRLQRAGGTFGAWLVRHRAGLYMLALAALWLFVQRMDFDEQIAAEQERRAVAEIKLQALADWHRERNVRVTLEGSPSQVSNLANQVAAAVRP